MKTYNGFTLMEILIALMILTIIGVMMMSGLQSAIRSQDRIHQNAIKLARLQEAMVIMERDIEQIIDRPTYNADGSSLPAVMSTGNSNYLEFTRTGLVNPFGVYQRSSLQRVGYECQGGVLSRLIWPTVDRLAKKILPYRYVLLSDVSQCSMQLFYGPSKKQLMAMTAGLQKKGNVMPQPLPDAVQVDFSIKGMGNISRFIALQG